jgi:alpha-tubulin suppressor-like RCC1 family protein
MSAPRFTPREFLAALVTLAALASCKTATQAQVSVRTNVSFRAGVNMALWASGSGIVDPNAPLAQSSEPWLGDGNLGDVVVVPGAASDGPLQIRVVLGVGRDARTCSDADPKGCIVAKRKLAFVPNKQIRVPIVMHLACQGIVCGGDTTCNYLGQCVSSVIEPGACTGNEGCIVAGDETVKETLPDNISAPEARPADAGTDAELPPALPDDAGADTALPPLQVTSIAAGGDHACALFSTGQIKCWGRNDRGQLGLGDTADRGALPGQMGANLPFVDVDPIRTVKSLALGNDHTCAILNDDNVKCWGENSSGQLGVGDSADRGTTPGDMGAALPTVDLGTGLVARQVTVGFAHTCARLNDDTLKCWGNNSLGQLGVVPTASRGDDVGEMGDACPIMDLGGVTVNSVAAGDAHTCARASDNTLRCWGYALFGQLGTGTRIQGVPLGTGIAAASVALGYTHSCARLSDGTVKCWGDNSAGQLGLGDTSNRGGSAATMGDQLPAVPLGGNADRLVSGSSHVCAQTGQRWTCWGKNNQGQLGYGDLADLGDGPGELAAAAQVELGGGGPVSMSLGTAHTCALGQSGAVKCWGQNNHGQLGLGDTIRRGGDAATVPALNPPIQL